MGVLRPAGPLPARVYWFRRLVVVGIPLVLVAVVVWVLVGRGGSSPDDGAGAGQDAAPATDATEPAEDEDPGTRACDPQTLGLTLTADGTSYAAGALPNLTVTLSNEGEEPCLIDVGEAQRELVVTSGADRIWSSRDCAAPETQVREILISPGTPDATQVQWPRVRSAEGCPADQPAAQPGTYSAALTLGPLAPAPVVFVLE
ncbi:hypothetical protein [Cellulomonas cellasea]|uniref:DUF4232 domain-containing protein n=2 Tax=Cellulomonas cellasea TaxID=43670 RepID=A0A0A0B7A5_9CELL|nr:hypothetical protein [Cellulomonas cellasea]KGM01684.1 hypothetical protein Q760_18070 [Cellulomonas cellasea DSM 20118]GEA87991.1 hypothetical protein CCE01nite_19400 [Cellulomonas cellasea]